nr:hypothetical protein [Tanacetum cinerariifolium]
MFHEQTDNELTKAEIKLMIKQFRPFFSVFLKTSMLLLIVVKLLRNLVACSTNDERQYDGQNVGNQNGYNAGQNFKNQNSNKTGNVVAARAEGNAIGNNADLDEIEKVNSNCILMANLQQASTSGIQTDKAPVYDSDGSTK